MRLTLSVLVAVGWLAPILHAEETTQAPEGFSAIFNGENLEGWQGGSTADPRQISAQQQAEWDAEVPGHWRVEGAELVSDGHGPHLATKRDFGDFEFWVDWKLSPKGDSGIYLRGTPQVQLWDPWNVEAHANGSDKGSGGLWNNQQHERFPTAVADNPIGQWNRMYVRMVGPYVTVELNGKKIVDNVVLENYYDRSIPVFRTGTIHLQTHGSETRFRNLFVREIPASEANRTLAEISGDDGAFKPLMNGRDLAGWIGATGDYEVVDGAIQTKPGRGGNLLTEEPYDNFAVRLEFKLPPGGNSGLAIRTPDAATDAAFGGLEVQVLDDSPEHYPDLHDYQTHGSVYGLIPALRGYLRPAGEWNYQETVVDGDRVLVRLNGFTILNGNLSEAAKQPLDGREHPGATRKMGHFGFAGHGDPVAFRNVRIKRLGGE